MVLLDTNFVIAILKQHASSQSIFEKISQEHETSISIITYVELLSVSQREVKNLRQALSDLTVVSFDSLDVAEQAARYRHEFGMHAPDAIIAATCLVNQYEFYTFDKDFKKLKQSWIHVLDY